MEETSSIMFDRGAPSLSMKNETNYLIFNMNSHLSYLTKVRGNIKFKYTMQSKLKSEMYGSENLF